MALTIEFVRHLQRLESKASPAPWVDLPAVSGDQARYYNPHARTATNSMVSWATGPICQSSAQAGADAEFIAAVRSAMPELILHWERTQECPNS